MLAVISKPGPQVWGNWEHRVGPCGPERGVRRKHFFWGHSSWASAWPVMSTRTWTQFRFPLSKALAIDLYLQLENLREIFIVVQKTTEIFWNFCIRKRYSYIGHFFKNLIFLVSWKKMKWLEELHPMYCFCFFVNLYTILSAAENYKPNLKWLFF